MDAIAANISREYEVPREQAERDVAGFIAELETEGFLARGMESR